MNDIIYGIHAVQALLNREPNRLLDVYLLKERHDRPFQNLIQQLKKASIVIQMVSRNHLNEKVKGAIHQGVIAHVQPRKEYRESDLLTLLRLQTMPLLLILDGITDPHNLGACLRCANAAGVHAVIIPRNRAAPLNATAKKVASGAAETIPLIRVTNLVRTLRLLQEHNVWIIGTVVKIDHYLYQSKLTGPLALVMGAEDKGIRRLTQKHCDELMSIPTFGTISSLNVSVATGICLFEIVRQRRKNNFSTIT